MGRPEGSAALVLVGTGTPLHPAPTLFEAMLEGWRQQHAARRLSPSITTAREQVVRRFQAFAGSWPWEWQPAQLDAWIGQGGWAHSTVRSYQGAVALFLDYVCDPRYEWAQACAERVGVVPAQICLLAPVVFVHPFRLNPYSDSGVFVHPRGWEAM